MEKEVDMEKTDQTIVSEKTAGDASAVNTQFALTLVSGLVFIGVIALSGFFYWKNTDMDRIIAENRTKTQEYQRKIDVLKADPLVRAGELFIGQKEALSRSIDRSNAAKYVRELEKMQKEFGFFFTGFSFFQDKINTSVMAPKGLDSDGVQKLIRFIAGYREGKPAM